METSSCPTTHPYAFSGGRECCRTKEENNGVVRKRRSLNGTEEILSRQKRHPHTGTTCDDNKGKYTGTYQCLGENSVHRFKL